MGNRQQSRFLALMENYDRLVEVQEGAMNSEDAGLVQYAKTLDSLDSKLNQLKNNFQTFYMEIFNGDFFKGIVDTLTNVVSNISRLGTAMGSLKILGLINQVKLLGQAILNTVSGGLGQVRTEIKNYQNEFTQGWGTTGQSAGEAAKHGILAQIRELFDTIKKESQQTGQEVGENIAKGSKQGLKTGTTSTAQRAWSQGLTTLGVAATSYGLTQSSGDASAGWQFAGGLLSTAGSAVMGGPVGWINAGLTLVSTLANGISYLSQRAEVLYEEAKKAAEEANIERATKQSEARNLESTINNLKKLQKAQYDSEEAQQEYIDACNTAAETYPELVSSFTTSGDAIIDVVNDTANAEYLLAKARKEAAEATYTAAAAEGLAASRKLENDKLNKVFFSNRGDLYVFGSQGGYNPYNLNISNSAKQAIAKETGHDFQLESVDDLNELVSVVAEYERLSDGDKINSPLRDIYDNLSGLVQSLGFGTRNDIESNGLAAVWNKGYQDYLIKVNSLKASNQATNRAYANQWITNQDPLKEADWRNLTGMESLLAHSVDDLINQNYYTNGELNDTGKGVMDKVIQPLYEAVETFTKGLSITKQEKWNEVLESWNKGTISIADYLEQMSKFGLDVAAGTGKLENELRRQLNEDVVGSISRAEKLLGIGGNNIFTYRADGWENEKTYTSIEDWGKDFVLDEQNVKAYIKNKYGNVSQEEQALLEKILLLPEVYREQVANQIADLNEIINDVDKPVGQRKAAEAQKKLLSTLDYSLIPEGKEDEFFSLFLTDMGTNDWAEAIKAWIEKNAPEMAGYIDEIKKSIYENAVTRIQATVDELSKVGDQIKEYENKQKNGWSYQEAKTFVKTMNDLGRTDYSLDDFVIDAETGQYVLKNYVQAMDDFYKETKGNLQEQIDGFEIILANQTKLLGLLNDDGSYIGTIRKVYDKVPQEYKEYFQKDIRKKLEEEYGITDSEWLDKLVEVIITGTEEEMKDLFEAASEAQIAAVEEMNVLDAAEKYRHRSDLFSSFSAAKDKASSFKSLLSASKLSDLETLYVAYGGTADPETFINSIQGATIDTFGNVVITNIEEYAAWLQSIMSEAGIDYNDADVRAAIEDALLSVIKTLTDSISAGLKGTLSAANLQQMAAQVSEENRDAFLNSFTLTSTGYKVNRNNFQTAAQGFLEAGNSAGLSTYNIANQIAEWATDAYDVADAYDIITEAEENASGELKQILALTRQIVKETADTREFDFMNVDALEGAADNLDKITSSMSSAISALNTAMEGDGKMSYKQFESMFNWMRDFGGSNLEQDLFGMAGGFDAFHAAVAKTIDYSGNVNVGAALSELGKNFTDFSDGMGNTFKDIAKQQADYWEGQAKFFDKLADLEKEISDEKIEIDPLEIHGKTDEQIQTEVAAYRAQAAKAVDKVQGEGTFTALTAEIDWSKYNPEETEKIIKGLIDALNSGDVSQVQAWAENLGLMDTNLTGLVGIETDSITSKAEGISGIGDAADTSKDQVNNLSAAISAIPTAVTTTITVATKTTGPIAAAATAVGSAVSKLFGGSKAAAAEGGIAPGGKTLVGELGPELGVYNGMYHLLGQNGAEFVNLPKQALIFNHAQTQALLKGKSGVRIGGSAMAEGNVSGPAFAGGYAAAAQRAREIAELWRGLESASITDLLGGSSGGGGGGDDTIKATTEELEEWYNLSRRIANVEQEINNIIAERENIMEGDKYLRSLREQQVLLKEQQQLQKTLLNYQQLQLKRQADLINTNKLWSQFLTVTEEGLLQYVQGNETNGGKGALKVLQELNEMSGADQVAFLNKIGYSYTDQDGNVLEGAELVQQFFDDLQNEIDKYDELYDTVHETKETIEELTTNVQEINDEILENQMDLEKEIFDTLVDAWEKQIEEMKEQNELMKQANEDYVKGLNDALTKEKDLYSQNESVAERESLQRRLSLLQRSGGSATEIANLQDEIDSMLKDEYFNSQEDMIQNIEEANDRQVELMEQQVQLQQDALDYEKEHGVLWTKVYEIMSGSSDEILEFMQGNTSSFFEKSVLQQEEMLTEWAKKIGIYTEDQQYKNYEARARDIFAGALSADQTHVYSRLAADEQSSIQDLFNSTFANSMLNGMSESEAIAAALAAIQGSLPTEQTTTSATSAPTTETSTSTGAASEGAFRYVYMTGEQETAKDGFEVGAYRQIGINTNSYDENVVRNTIKAAAKRKGVKLTGSKLVGFSSGGLVDYTGLAMVHGSSSKPEAFLNAEQTAQIKEALTEQGRGSILRNAISILQDIGHSVSSLVSNISSSVSIAPGAIVINVDELNDAYDIEDISNDIMSRITSIASRATNTSVSRR